MQYMYIYFKLALEDNILQGREKVRLPLWKEKIKELQCGQWLQNTSHSSKRHWHTHAVKTNQSAGIFIRTGQGEKVRISINNL